MTDILNNNVDKTPPTSWEHCYFSRQSADYDVALYSQTDPTAQGIITTAHQIQGEDYVRSGYIEADKLTPDGQLIDLADIERDITYVVAHRNDTPEAEPEGSLKVIRVPEGQDLRALAAYEYAEGKFFDEYEDELMTAFKNDPRNGVVEIGGLSRVAHPKSAFVSYELIRDIMQRAVRAKTNEKWLITFTEKAFKPISAAFGPRVIRVAGDPVRIDRPDEHVTLVPSLINPMTLLDDLTQSVEEAPVGSKQRLIMSTTLLLMEDGMLPSEVSPQTRQLINNEKQEIAV